MCIKQIPFGLDFYERVVVLERDGTAIAFFQFQTLMFLFLMRHSHHRFVVRIGMDHLQSFVCLTPTPQHGSYYVRMYFRQNMFAKHKDIEMGLTGSKRAKRRV